MGVTVTLDGQAVDGDLTVEFRNGYQEAAEDTPSTNSDGHMWIWFMLMFVSGAGLFFLLLRESKYQRKH